MIRVGQMAFAQMIRRHKQVNSPEQMGDIIALFNDMEKTQPFSIHSISQYARKEYGILPGDWYNPSQITQILSMLNQNSIQKAMGLSFLVFNSGNLFFDQVIEVMLGTKSVVHCSCEATTKQLICPNCNKA